VKGASAQIKSIQRYSEIERGRLPDVENGDIIAEIHRERYRFAARLVLEGRVLDIACGIGYGSKILAQEDKVKQVIGVDVSSEAIHAAKQKFGGNKLSFQLASGERLPFQDNCFDSVVSLETIEHMAKPVCFLAELRRVLRPGGVIVISTPNRRFHSCGRRKPWNPYHTVEYEPLEFRSTLLDHVGSLEFWGGQEFSEVNLWSLVKYNWIEIKYYQIVHHPIVSKLILPLIVLKRWLVHPKASVYKHGILEPSLQHRRCQVTQWLEGCEPYTMVAVCRKRSH
jgi:ubiquinone/menaquinone biosynthesis C-methylase UbiE